MARKIRHANAVPEPVAAPASDRVYKTAIYIRLSIEDIRDRKDSLSLTNQQDLLEQFIADRPFLQPCGVFSDNGETGVNFLRPSFQQMISACKAGRIDCIVVKDLSRLGRNYIETGEYMERIFPFLGVRLIAVNDGYDSLKNIGGLAFSLKNLVNDIYAKDISRKSSAALRTKQKKGDFIGSFAAYGYLKTLEDKNKIVVDEETAPVVRDIFKWKADGVGTAHICRKLNDVGISAPSRYRFDKGILKDKRYVNCIWNVYTVKTILQNPVYLGHMAQGKHNSALYECWERERAPMSEWVIVENTHTPIVDESLFYQAQRVMTERTEVYKANAGRYDCYQKPENILQGLVYCADCGKPLYRYKSVTCKGTKVAYIFQCRTHTTYLDKGCPKKYIHETELRNMVHAALKAKVETLVDIESIVERLNCDMGFRDRMSDFDRQSADIQNKLNGLTIRRQEVYDDYADRLLTEQEYHFALGRYDAEMNNLKKREGELEQMKESLSQNKESSNKWLNAFRRFMDGSELTTEMARLLVKRITVSSDNAVDVTYNFKDEFMVASSEQAVSR